MRFMAWRYGIFFLLFLLSPAVFFATGCRKAPRKQGSLSIPTEGNVRVVSTKVEEIPNRLHWKWSVIGERNWRKPSVSGTAASLASTYTLNDATERGGCNIWEMDLAVEDGHWAVTLHGSDGKTAKAEGALAAGSADLSQAVIIREDDDRLTSLPADLSLATVDGKPLTLHIER